MAINSERTQGAWRAILPLLAGFFLVIASSSVVSVATSEIATDLGASAAQAVWVTSGYLVALVSLLLLAGRLGDRFGPMNVFNVGVAAFTAGNLLAGLADSIEALIAARIVQGVGASLMTPQPLTVITRMLPADRRGPALGAWGATSGVALLVGPLAGGVVLDAAGWPAIFVVNVPLGVVVGALVLRFVPRLAPHSSGFDLLGTALSAAAILAIAFAVQQGPTVGWGRVLGVVTAPAMVGIGLALLVAFVVWERSPRNAQPLVPLTLFADRDFTLSGIAVLAAGSIATSIGLPILVWAQDAGGLSPLGSAGLIAPMAVATMVLAPRVGQLYGRYSPRLIATIGFAGTAMSLAGFALLMADGAAAGWLAVPSFLLGASSAGIWGPLAISATARTPTELAGAASGVYNTLRQLGGVLGVAAVSVGMQLTIAAKVPSRATGGSAPELGPLPANLTPAFGDAMALTLIGPLALALLGGVAAALLRSSRPHARPEISRPTPNDEPLQARMEARP